MAVLIQTECVNYLNVITGCQNASHKSETWIFRSWAIYICQQPCAFLNLNAEQEILTDGIGSLTGREESDLKSLEVKRGMLSAVWMTRVKTPGAAAEKRHAFFPRVFHTGEFPCVLSPSLTRSCIT